MNHVLDAIFVNNFQEGESIDFRSTSPLDFPEKTQRWLFCKNGKAEIFLEGFHQSAENFENVGTRFPELLTFSVQNFPQRLKSVEKCENLLGKSEIILERFVRERSNKSLRLFLLVNKQPRRIFHR